ncbi:type I restriction enzyme, R subunit [Agreia bicolorata]|uniref:Type I restriction enzyme endonuclease subunit n=1 Tax=Agreia bicolorata TaxID=110935 RepID=A0A1T4YEM5_9MICO|nr:HsdR family type I site-specific deoxyribonuclease [Agreia bicolorata]SKB00287.1 type I restriction enzyme, R subunit [Agreia bicolorata]
MTEPTFDPSEKLQSQLPALQMLISVGFTPLSPAEALALRGGRRRHVILDDILTERIVALNQFEHRGASYPVDLSDAQEAIRKLTSATDQPKGLQAANQAAYDTLVLGATVAKTIDGNTKSRQLRFIDWDDSNSNVYHVTVEYAVDRSGSASANRLDVVAFVNGIPFIAIECKRPSEEVKKADHQLLRYQRPQEIPGFFEFAQLLVATNRREARYATVGTPSKFWSPWVEEDDSDDLLASATAEPLPVETLASLFPTAATRELAEAQLPGLASRAPSEQDRLIHSICRPERLLRLVRAFTIVDGGVRKIARHQQYFAVTRALERVTSGSVDAPRPGGVIWHTQGSGKSLTMIMLAKALEFDPRIVSPRVILVTDRDDLDKQIRDTFRSCQLDPVRARSGAHLAGLITSKTPLVTTIVNKFENAAKQLETSSPDEDINVFVLVDESHRSQSARLGEYGTFAKMMHRVLPRANYVGFTGTPLLKKEKNTYRTFGAPIHNYTIRDAQRDEAVVPLLYEGRVIEKQIADSVINVWFDKICEGLTPEQQADLKRKFSRADVLAGAGQVIRAKAFDISEHYRQHWQGTGLKAQLIAPNKAAAVRFKDVLDEIGHVRSEVLISAPSEDETIEATDRDSREIVTRFWDAQMERFGNETRYAEEIISNFKGAGGPEIVIVVSKLLTGFDAPRNTVLYICRSLREHTLLQAIARVNRLFEPEHDEDPPKDFGHIIDYEGLLSELDEALTTYSALEGFELEDLLGAVVDVRTEIATLDARWSAVWSLFPGIRHDDQEALEQYLEPVDRREDFYAALSSFTRTLHIALSSNTADEVISQERLDRYKTDWAAFLELRRSVQQRYNETVDLRDYEPKIQRLLDDHLTALPATVIIPPIDLSDPAAVSDAAGDTRQRPAARADRIANATKRRISERMDEDPALYRRFSELIQQAIDDHRAHRLSELEYLERIRQLADDVTAERRDRALPATLAHNPAAASVFEEILKRFVAASGSPIAENIVAEIAIHLIDLVHSHHIVGIWENSQAQNDLLNSIDEYLWSDIEEARGIELTEDDEDSIRDTVIQIAKARFP